MGASSGAKLMPGSRRDASLVGVRLARRSEMMLNGATLGEGRGEMEAGEGVTEVIGVGAESISRANTDATQEVAVAEMATEMVTEVVTEMATVGTGGGAIDRRKNIEREM